MGLILVLALQFALAAPRDTRLLSTFVTDPTPYKHTEANSDQRQPLYIGATPREMELFKKLEARPQIRAAIKSLGELQAKQLLRELKRSRVQMEVWPFADDQGDHQWAFARWREPNGKWRWLESASETIHVSQVLRPSVPEERAQIFNHFREFDDLYAKPVFGDCVWTRNDEIIEAWLSPGVRENRKARFTNKEYVARVLPQPPRWNRTPITFVIDVSTTEVLWPSTIHWKKDLDSPSLLAEELPALRFTESFREKYKEDVRILTGEKRAEFPKSRRTTLFRNKSSAEPHSDLESMADYFEERYHALGLKTFRQRFIWDAIPQSNVWAVIPGKVKGPPIILADHFDTAFAEDVFNRTGRRVSTPGADDNATATATLLRAAEELKNANLKYPVWLLHLTGEEFPADDLGARKFLDYLIHARQDIRGLVLVDMIGYRRQGENEFQINTGDSLTSHWLAQLALKGAGTIPRWTPQYRGRFDSKSYLYNTDGYIFSHLGFPVVFFNESLNRTNIETGNPHYHHSTDVAANVDFEYASDIAKLAILTAFFAAN